MVDVEPAMEQRVQFPKDAVVSGNILNDHMAAHGVLARGERPDIEIMDLANPGDLSHCRGHLGEVDVRGCGLEQDVDRLWHGYGMRQPDADLKLWLNSEPGVGEAGTQSIFDSSLYMTLWRVVLTHSSIWASVMECSGLKRSQLMIWSSRFFQRL